MTVAGPKMNLAAIEVAVGAVLKYIDEDSGREGLWRTPERVAEMYAELFSGVGTDPAAEIDAIFSDDVTHDPVVVADLPFYSMCEHHLLPFFRKGQPGLHTRPTHCGDQQDRPGAGKYGPSTCRCRSVSPPNWRTPF